MKRPYLNMKQRQQVRLNTFIGSIHAVALAQARFLKSILKEKGYAAMKEAEKGLNEAYGLLTIK